MRTLTTVLLTIIILSGCVEVNTSEPIEAYKYWAGSNHPDNLEVLFGQYWQSPHWTREYKVFLKLKPSKEWWNKFLEENNLCIDTTDWIKPLDTPEWFQPSSNFIKYSHGDNFDQSRYFQDKLTGECLIFEIQL